VLFSWSLSGCPATATKKKTGAGGVLSLTAFLRPMKSPGENHPARYLRNAAFKRQCHFPHGCGCNGLFVSALLRFERSKNWLQFAYSDVQCQQNKKNSTAFHQAH
jgi:hypothetical protein